MKKSALMAGVAIASLFGSMSAFAASPGDVANGFAAGGLLGAAIDSSAASAPPQPVYASTYYLGQAAGVAAAALIVDSFNIRSLFLIATFGLPVIGGGFRWAIRHRNYA